MSQTAELVNTMKKALRAHGLSYAQVATTLELSEASVKRLFSEKSFSLHRLEQICQLMDMEISDLVKMMSEEHRGLSQLSLQQEMELATEPTQVMVTVCVLNRWKFSQILNQFSLTEAQCIKYLAKLDRLKIIELMPRNRIRLRIAPNFQWHENGPIQQFFQQHLLSAFFQTRFDHNDEKLLVFNGMLSDASNARFQRKMEQLLHDFDSMNNADCQLPFDERHGSTVVVAMRGWKQTLFENHNQSKSKK